MMVWCGKQVMSSILIQYQHKANNKTEPHIQLCSDVFSLRSLNMSPQFTYILCCKQSINGNVHILNSIFCSKCACSTRHPYNLLLSTVVSPVSILRPWLWIHPCLRTGGEIFDDVILDPRFEGKNNWINCLSSLDRWLFQKSSIQGDKDGRHGVDNIKIFFWMSFC